MLGGSPRLVLRRPSGKNAWNLFRANAQCSGVCTSCSANPWWSKGHGNAPASGMSMLPHDEKYVLRNSPPFAFLLRKMSHMPFHDWFSHASTYKWWTACQMNILESTQPLHSQECWYKTFCSTTTQSKLLQGFEKRSDVPRYCIHANFRTIQECWWMRGTSVTLYLLSRFELPKGMGKRYTPSSFMDKKKILVFFFHGQSLQGFRPFDFSEGRSSFIRFKTNSTDVGSSDSDRLDMHLHETARKARAELCVKAAARQGESVSSLRYAIHQLFFSNAYPACPAHSQVRERTERRQNTALISSPHRIPLGGV